MKQKTERRNLPYEQIADYEEFTDCQSEYDVRSGTRKSGFPHILFQPEESVLYLTALLFRFASHLFYAHPYRKLRLAFSHRFADSLYPFHTSFRQNFSQRRSRKNISVSLKDCRRRSHRRIRPSFLSFRTILRQYGDHPLASAGVYPLNRSFRSVQRLQYHQAERLDPGNHHRVFSNFFSDSTDRPYRNIECLPFLSRIPLLFIPVRYLLAPLHGKRNPAPRNPPG